MPEFLQLLPPPEALALLLSNLSEHLPERIILPTQDACGRVTALPVFAPEMLPAFARSTVDGYAVIAGDTYGASDSLPVYLNLIKETPMGAAPDFQLKSGQASLIHTGGMLPEGSNAVVMLENTQNSRQCELEVLKAVGTGENILEPGEDVLEGEVVIPAGHPLRPAEIGGLMALGMITVTTVRKPKVAVISSGDEVIPPDQKPNPGQVRDVNSYSLSALIARHGGEPVQYGIVTDQREAYRTTLSRAVKECDLVVITAGSSASTRDLTAEVIDEMGPPGVLVHGVNVRPGKPTILGVCSGKAVIGLPGNPVSALVIAGLFVRPVIDRLLGLSGNPFPAMMMGKLSINVASQAGREDWIPCKIISEENGYRIDPIFYKSNLIFTLAKADGLVFIPADANGYSAGEKVQIFPL